MKKLAAPVVTLMFLTCVMLLACGGSDSSSTPASAARTGRAGGFDR